MDEQQLQQQIVQLVQAAMQGDQQATQQIQQIMQAAQQGDQQAAQLAQMIQQVAQQMQQQQVQAAKFGAKLNYIKQLRGVCPDGYEMKYFKAGGQLCKQCVAKQKKMEEGGKAPSNPVDAFKCGRKMKKKACGGLVKKNQTGGPLQNNVSAVGVNGNNYISKPSAKLHATNAIGTTRGKNRLSTTVNWSDGTSTQVNGQNGTVTGRDGIPYQMNTAQADSVMRNDIAGPYLATLRSGQPFQINDRSRRMGVNTFKR